VNLSSASYDFLYNYALALADDGKLNDALVKIEESLGKSVCTDLFFLIVA
jgi:hypothetical protein